MLHSKYVIIDNGYVDVPVIFGPLLQHADVARALNGTVLSAGFVRIDQDGKVEAYGDSFSLKIGSREEDTAIIQKMLTYGTYPTS